MTRVFIGGSRHVTRLNAHVLARLDNIVEKELPVLIGDANGADKAIQKYFCSRGYQNVTVFCSDGLCRNNLGKWEVRAVPSGTRERDFRFYSAKDRAMAQEAVIGFMVWDGKSIGTLLNIFRLVSRQKKVLVYTLPKKSFSELRISAEWDQFIASYGAELRQKLERRANLEAPPAQISLPV